MNNYDREQIVTCVFCGTTFTSLRRLALHKRHQHRQEQVVEEAEKTVAREQTKLVNKNNKVICELCKEALDSLVTHVKYKHNISISEYRKLYPGARVQRDTREKSEFKCTYCNRVYDFNNSLQLHIKRKHSEFYIKKRGARTVGIKCEICNKYYINFSQHVELAHNMDFEQYRVDFNYKDLRTFVTEEHKQNLSENKLNFYNNTEKGSLLKERQSVAMTGDKNPACREGVRAKISQKAMNRRDNFKYASRGIHVNFWYNDINYHTRSFIEFKLLIMLLENSIQFEYEKERIYYINSKGKSHYYYPDLLINNTFYEIKSKDNECIAEEKYQIVFDLIRKRGQDIRMLSPESLAKELNLTLYNEDYYCKKALELVKENKIKLTWYSSCHSRSRILEKIDINYLNDKEHFNVVLCDVEYGNRRTDAS